MNEVKRYHVTEAGLVEGSALGRINVVLGTDHDRVTADADRLRAELECSRGDFVQLERIRDALQQLLNQRDEQVETLKLQHQGEPVAIIERARKIEQHREAFEQRFKLDIWPVIDWLRNSGLYAEQPAPVAVDEMAEFTKWTHQVIAETKHQGVTVKMQRQQLLSISEHKAAFDAWNYRASLGAPVAAPLNYGSLDPVQRLAVCRGDAPAAVPVVPELTSELRWILGQMCFQHIHTAQALRLMGHEIARKAEDEQAVTIYWMLGHYLKDPANWRQNASAEMKAAAPAA